MGFTKACLKVQHILQQIVLPPFRLSSENAEIFVAQSFFATGSQSRQRWIITKLCINLLFVFSAIRIKTLAAHRKEGNNTEQLCVYTMLPCLAQIIVVSLDTLESTRNELSFVTAQSLKLVRYQHNDFSSRGWISYLKEMFVYEFACASIAMITLVPAGLTLLRDYLPLNLLCKLVIGKIDSELNLEAIIRPAIAIVHIAVGLHGGCSLVVLIAIITTLL